MINFINIENVKISKQFIRCNKNWKKKFIITKIKYIEITEKDKKANELYNFKVVPNFKFEEDFYYNLAMKYITEIESNPFFSDFKKMPKRLPIASSDCIDIKWLSNEVMKIENLKNIYMKKFRGKYVILIYTEKPKLDEEDKDKPFKEIIELYLKENKDKTFYDYFYSKLSMDPKEIKKSKQ